jgi:hypothetical protein
MKLFNKNKSNLGLHYQRLVTEPWYGWERVWELLWCGIHCNNGRYEYNLSVISLLFVVITVQSFEM